MADNQFDQEFVEYVVRAIVNHPDDVRTERIVDERGVLITLFINQEDMGYVIGRQGQTARAVRTLLKIVGAKENARVNLKIFEPEGSRRPPREDRNDRTERTEFMSRQKKRQFDVITIFPSMIDAYAEESILGRAQKKNLIKINAHDLRDYTEDKHHTVDDTPYGGGPGMLLKVGPIEKATKKIKKRGAKTWVIVTAASGKLFTQKDAKRLAKYDQLIFICGRYEGIDHRVEQHVADESFSIGGYVLTGGELPSLVMIDAVARMVPGVLGSKESLESESHDEEGVLEYPQYTKPDVYKKWSVPEVLLSGDHKKIAEWKDKNQKTPR